MSDPKVIVALDYDDEKSALDFVSRVNPDICKLKVGNELFTTAGPSLVSKLCDKGFKVFLDLKYHDIPNTVARACEAAAKLGVWMVNVHAMGGEKMMTKAAEALREFGSDRPTLIAVTVLTSMDASQLSGVGIQDTVENEVTRLAVLARNSGMDGVVSSAREAGLIRSSIPGDFCIVTPGIRPGWAETNDQVRIVTPGDALKGGSDYLVIGRPITRSRNPSEALRLISEEIAAAIQITP